ncbi:MAG TPA: arginine deiminase family protein [Actinomycetota bacterium]|nr:arginine deiminase family protein [Actinomycetota bacterium]
MSTHDAVGPLRRVYVRPPDPQDASAWRTYGWRAAPDPARAADEHEAFRAELIASGAEVVVGRTRVTGDPDAIYAYDPTLPTDRGLIVLRPGKPGRRLEPSAIERDLNAEGIPTLGALEAPATAEGGDMLWLDEGTLLAGRGYRTNDAGIGQLRELLGPEVEIVWFDLPHHEGPDSCLHLMSFISMLDRDLAVVFLPMMPVRLLDLLRERGVELVEVPDQELGSQGPNVLALAPRVALALEGSPETRRRMEAAGVDVRTFAGEEISRKGDGGPTCLSRPLERG